MGCCKTPGVANLAADALLGMGPLCWDESVPGPRALFASAWGSQSWRFEAKWLPVASKPGRTLAARTVPFEC